MMIYKKRITLILILKFALSAGIQLQAQVIPFGIRAGLNLSTLAGNSEVTFLPGYHFGFLAEKQLAANFIFQHTVLRNLPVK